MMKRYSLLTLVTMLLVILLAPSCKKFDFNYPARGEAIGAFQLTQRKLAELAVALNQAQLTARRLGALKDAGRIKPAQVSFGKFANVRACLEICREARSILGANGITIDYPALRHAVNLETVYTYEGTHEVHTLVLGEELTGLSAFR